MMGSKVQYVLLILMILGTLETLGSKNYKKYNFDDIDYHSTAPNEEIKDSSTHQTIYEEQETIHTPTESLNESNNESRGALPMEFLQSSPKVIFLTIFIALFLFYLSPLARSKNEIIEDDIDLLEEIEQENGLIADITESMNEEKKEEKEDEIEGDIVSTDSESHASDNNAIIQTPLSQSLIVAPSKDNLDAYLEHTATKTDENYRKIMILYEKKEAEGLMTIDDYHKMIQLQETHEQTILKRENRKTQKTQADALQLAARNSTEALAFKRTKLLFDFFEKKESFIRYWSMCALLAVWGLCKLRSFAPTTTNLNLVGNSPWWIPSFLIPNITFVVPVAIIGSLIFVIIIIFLTQGNTIASVLIFATTGLIILWSSDSTTISTGIFCFARLIIISTLYCAISSIIYNLIIKITKDNWFTTVFVYPFGLLSLISCCYLGYFVSITDYPNLQFSFEYRLLDYLDSITETI